MPNSSVYLSVYDDKLAGEAKIPLMELGMTSGQSIDRADPDQPSLRHYLISHIQAFSPTSRWHTEISSIEFIPNSKPLLENYPEVIVHFFLIPDHTASLREFDFHYDVILHQETTHRILVFLRYDWRNGLQHEGALQRLGIIKADDSPGKYSPLHISIPSGSWWLGFRSMFLMGMDHIREGLDHILFLLTLLLITPLAVYHKEWSTFQGISYTLKRFLKISLAFTIGHSTTLLIGAFELVSFRVQYVEILVALSIIISAWHCIKPLFFHREILIAGGFGLVHGLAFSLTLSNMTLGISSKIISIFAFNLGIESMQLIIMIAVFPMLLLSRWKFYRYLRISIAVITMIASAGWVAERIADRENVITHYLNFLQ